jgi:hypothetical protein
LKENLTGNGILIALLIIITSLTKFHLGGNENGKGL